MTTAITDARIDAAQAFIAEMKTGSYTITFPDGTTREDIDAVVDYGDASQQDNTRHRSSKPRVTVLNNSTTGLAKSEWVPGITIAMPPDSDSTDVSDHTIASIVTDDPGYLELQIA